MIKSALQLLKQFAFRMRMNFRKNNASVLKRWKESKLANIVEGYTLTFKNNDNPENGALGFRFYAEINIDNQKLCKPGVSSFKTLSR